MSVLHETLRRARRRMVLAALPRHAVWSFLAASFVALLWAAARLLWDRPPLDSFAICLTVAGAILLTALRTYRQFPDLRTTALRLDLLGQTRDRFTAGLALDDKIPFGPLEQLAMEECRGYASKFDERPLLPMRLPASSFALAVPAVAAIFLFLHYRAAQRVDPAALAAQQELAQKADELEELQKKLASAAQEDPRLHELAQAVQDAIERLQKAARSKEADSRSAMEELSAIEAMLASTQAALAAQAEAMEKAAQQAEAGDPDSASAAAKAMAQSAIPEEQRAQIEQAISDAKAAGQMDQAAREKALKNLAEQLRRMKQNSTRSQPASASQRQLQAAMNALQNIKYGKSGGRSHPRPNHEETNSRTTVEGFGPGSDKGPNGQVATGLPSGQPGREKDEGTTESPFGEQTKLGAPLREDTQLDAVLSDGESLADLVPAVFDSSKSTRRYRDLYNAVAAEAQNTVDREDIPLASRFFIKRYFENIRPAE